MLQYMFIVTLNRSKNDLPERELIAPINASVLYHQFVG